jgi:hypothetical protein
MKMASKTSAQMVYGEETLETLSRASGAIPKRKFTTTSEIFA